MSFDPLLSNHESTLKWLLLQIVGEAPSELAFTEPSYPIASLLTGACATICSGGSSQDAIWGSSRSCGSDGPLQTRHSLRTNIFKPPRSIRRKWRGSGTKSSFRLYSVRMATMAKTNGSIFNPFPFSNPTSSMAPL
jgi:hypothetical protein